LATGRSRLAVELQRGEEGVTPAVATALYSFSHGGHGDSPGAHWKGVGSE